MRALAAVSDQWAEKLAFAYRTARLVEAIVHRLEYETRVEQSNLGL